MLTTKMVTVRYARNHLIPCYLDVDDTQWLATAERLIQIYRTHREKSRGELEDEISETFGDAPNQQVYQGLAKLLEDRCEFAVVSVHPPEQLREAIFCAAQHQRRDLHSPTTENSAHGPQGDGTEFILFGRTFSRQAVLERVARDLELTPVDLEKGMFADLRSEQQMTAFKDISPQRLLQRYNVALAQAILLRAASVQVVIRGEPPQRYRQLLRRMKFHRLMCDIEPVGTNAYCFKLDGPLSLFSATQKYGLQLALFFPAILQCHDFELEADVRWGPARKPKKFRVTPMDGLVSHLVDSGTYVPPELAMFAELFRKRQDEWEISDETELVPLGGGFWVPDFQLIHKKTGQIVYMEVLGFWRRRSAEQHLHRLREYAPGPFLLAVSEQLHVEESGLENLPGEVLRFRQMPLPADVVRAANALIGK